MKIEEGKEWVNIGHIGRSNMSGVWDGGDGFNVNGLPFHSV